MTDGEDSKFNWQEFGQKTWVVVASLIVFPPLGLFLLWRHPVLGKQRNWWVGACIWGVLWFVGNLNREESASNSSSGSSASPSSVSDDALEADARRYVELQRELLAMSMAMTKNMSQGKKDLGYDSARSEAIGKEADSIKKKYTGSKQSRFDEMVKKLDAEFWK